METDVFLYSFWCGKTLPVAAVMQEKKQKAQDRCTGFRTRSFFPISTGNVNTAARSDTAPARVLDCVVKDRNVLKSVPPPCKWTASQTAWKANAKISRSARKENRKKTLLFFIGQLLYLRIVSGQMPTIFSGLRSLSIGRSFFPDIDQEEIQDIIQSLL